MARQIGSDQDFTGAARIINLPDGVLPQHPATMAQLNSAIEGLSSKDSARVSTQGNINLAAPGASIDGITMAGNDRVLVRAQTTPAENGIYVFVGAASAMVRAPDANTASELEAAVLTVEEGSSAGATFRQTSVNFVLGTGPVAFVNFGSAAPVATEATAGIAAIATQAEVNAGTDDSKIITSLKLAQMTGRVRKLSGTFGDGTATQFTLTHNFNTDDVQVEVYRATGAKDSIICDVERTSVNAVILRFAAAPAINAFRAVAIG